MGDTALANMSSMRDTAAAGLTDTIPIAVGGDSAAPGKITVSNLLGSALAASFGATTITTLTVTTSNVTTSVISSALNVGSTATERAAIKGIYTSTLSVTVPSITDPDIAKVDVDVSSLTFQPVVGDMVIVSPVVALPTNARLQGAWVSDTDQVQITYGSEGGNVTGAAKNHKFLFFDLT